MLEAKDYILQRSDTKEFLKELLVVGDSGIVGWSTSVDEANVFECLLDIKHAAGLLSDTLEVDFYLYQVIKVQQTSLVRYICTCFAETLK